MLVEIVRGIFIGDWADAQEDNCRIVGITHVLCVVPHRCAPAQMQTTYQSLKCFHWHYEDELSQAEQNPLEFMRNLDRALEFIGNAKREGKVLVHCVAGRYRSPRVVALYLHVVEAMSVEDAVTLIQSTCPGACLLPGEVEQLAWIRSLLHSFFIG